MTTEQDWIEIDGERFEVSDISDGGYLPSLELEGGTDWYVAEDSESAGTANREYWEEMANNDPKEFTAIVGEETLVAWALGQYAGPGYEKVKSLDEWLELVAEYPEEQWAGYDGEEKEVNACSQSLIDQLGFTPTVAYRWN